VNDVIKKILTFFFYFTCFFLENANAIQRVIVFDFGGVIAQANTVQMTDFLTRSFNISKEELSSALREMQTFIIDEGTEEQFWYDFAVSKKIKLPIAWFDQFGIVIKNSITAIPETLVLVKTLQNQGYQTAMLSDVTQYQAEIIRKMGYYDLFNPVLLSYEIGVKKPHPEAFKILLQKLQLPASFAIFIDDRIENVKAAKNQGIDAILFINPTQLKEELEKRGL
jgi:putative hydrolase of the HAD superfamily